MKYMAVYWKHNFDGEPTVIYSEVNEERWEVRKVEEFANGHRQYACRDEYIGDTRLSSEPVPSNDEISNDPQFEPHEITAGEFESVWFAARLKRPDLAGN